MFHSFILFFFFTYFSFLESLKSREELQGWSTDTQRHWDGWNDDVFAALALSLCFIICISSSPHLTLFPVSNWMAEVAGRRVLKGPSGLCSSASWSLTGWQARPEAGWTPQAESTRIKGWEVEQQGASAELAVGQEGKQRWGISTGETQRSQLPPNVSKSERNNLLCSVHFRAIAAAMEDGLERCKWVDRRGRPVSNWNSAQGKDKKACPGRWQEEVGSVALEVTGWY